MKSLRQAFEFRGIVHRRRSAASSEILRSNIDWSSVSLIVQLVELLASRIVFVDAGQAKLQQLPLHVVAGRRIGLRHIQAAQRVVDVLIQRQRRLRAADLGGHRGRVIAIGRVGMHLLHQSRKVNRRVQLPHRFVVGRERVIDGSGPLTATI